MLSFTARVKPARGSTSPAASRASTAAACARASSSSTTEIQIPVRSSAAIAARARSTATVGVGRVHDSSPDSAQARRSSSNAALWRARNASMSSRQPSSSALLVGQHERRLLDAQRELAVLLRGALLEQLVGGHGEPPQLVEGAQQPGVVEVGTGRGPVPHLHRAPDELVAARALHAVDAQVGAADADGVLGGPGPGRVVLGGDEPVPRVERRRHRGAEVDVAEAQDEVGGVEDDALRRRRRSRAR